MGVESILARIQRGIPLSRTEALELLALDPESPETCRLRHAAHRASLEWTGGKGYIWVSIGVDFVPCPMNCAFCSLGERWGIVREPWALDAEGVVERIRRYDLPHVRWIVLRTSEFYRIEDLVRIGRRVSPLRHARLVANTGEVCASEAESLYQAGFRLVYHALRLREGIDTGLDPERRLVTLDVLRNSPLDLGALVEPIGPEHTNEELVDRIFLYKSFGAVLTGAMARFPVPGTPKFALGSISLERLAQVVAVCRLAAGREVPAICAHPSDPRILASGANTVVVEIGSIPRDTAVSNGEWKGFSVEEARHVLQETGYDL